MGPLLPVKHEQFKQTNQRRWLPRSPDQFNTCGAIQTDFLPLLLKEPFYRSTVLAAVFTDLQVMAEVIFADGHTKEKVPESMLPTKDAFRCSICLEVL